MKDLVQQLSRRCLLSAKLGKLYQRRKGIAVKRLNERVRTASSEFSSGAFKTPLWPWTMWMEWPQYVTDFAQRSILFMDTLRQRGNNYVAHELAGKPPVLHFDYEIVVDGRKLKRPVNYALTRILPPKGIKIDPKLRPYVIIDPRAGHGPGIGGFKDDSQVGVALRAGHPVYFIIFFPEPEPGQTMLDVCDAEKIFVHKVRALHPASAKPVLIGNCQGGWAAMMLAAANPDEIGPIVINGAPMSYWGGSSLEDEVDNPMRYAGGILGGSWLASLAADLGNGRFDGAWLVQNMENLDLANTLWDKYYHVFANVDTEPPRFLEFERWWGGYFLMNREEIEWIVQNLFVGNELWKGTVASQDGKAFDLREIKSPIVLFASMGDNITPPQQAFNWVTDTYGSTEEIKARGQTIVGLLHHDIGHLGIFVSGRVAKKEHTQLVSVLKSIEALPPGLYGMQITESKGADGKVTYNVQFIEHRLEEIFERLNRFKRVGEKPFESVAALSEFNQRAYELFAQPFVQSFANETFARLGRIFHPLRFQRWIFSDRNPWMGWLKPAAEAVKAQRQPVGADQPFRKAEKATSDLISGSLDFCRDMRDTFSEILFFHIYGNMFLRYQAKEAEAQARKAEIEREDREKQYVKEALAAMDEGGYPAALARVGALLAQYGQSIPLSRIELKEELFSEYKNLLPNLTRDQMRRIRGRQDIIVHHEPRKAIESLPHLLPGRTDRNRLLTLLDNILADERVHAEKATPEQRAILAQIKKNLTNGHGKGMRVRKGAAV